LGFDVGRIIEFSEGHLEVHEMPGTYHQRIVFRLTGAFYNYLANHPIGEFATAPLPVRLWPGKYREPDLLFVSQPHEHRIGEKYWGPPDWVAEVISPTSAERDRLHKKAEYALAGIPEYWIVDPEAKTVEIYHLEGEVYALRHTFTGADSLSDSPTFPGLEIPLAEIFAEA